MFDVAPEPRDWGQIIAWWELRRIPFNLIVGLVGLSSLAVTLSFADLAHELERMEPGQNFIEPLLLALAPIVLNICYSAGWIVELGFRSRWPAIASLLMKVGLAFSVFALSLPALFWLVIWAVRAIH